jgi:hypothetical protein
MAKIEKFIEERNNIKQALNDASIQDIYTSKNKVPSKLPCAILTLAEETGKNDSSEGYLDSDIEFELFIVVNAGEKISDPDLEIFTLKEAFRESYKELLFKDIANIRFYDSKVSGTKSVKIARMILGGK